MNATIKIPTDKRIFLKNKDAYIKHIKENPTAYNMYTQDSYMFHIFSRQGVLKCWYMGLEANTFKWEIMI